MKHVRGAVIPVKKTVRIIISAACCGLLAISWLIVINSKSTAEKQLVLIGQAATLTNDGVYIRAVPLLEEAAGYNAAHTITAENELKKVYLALIGNRGFSRRYTELLEKQMRRKNAQSDIFIEAADYYLSTLKTKEALAVLKSGVEKTGSTDLIALYEDSRYAFEVSRTSYESITAIYKMTAQVQIDGKWGIAGADGIIMIPCVYDKISTFHRDRTIVEKDGGIYAVDKDNNRVAVPHETISDFGNLADDRIPLLIGEGWYRSTGEFERGASMFEDFGMYSEGYAAAKSAGKWGVIDRSMGWLISAEYDEIIRDELGRCYAQGAVFARRGDMVCLFSNGKWMEDVYQDARPFSGEGFAAVLKNGKWGFIDTNGVVTIDFMYDEALSFGQHLAAVKNGEFWGYISKYGSTVIDAVFYDAKSFSDGIAPVLTDRGWQFITLVEYR